MWSDTLDLSSSPNRTSISPSHHPTRKEKESFPQEGKHLSTRQMSFLLTEDISSQKKSLLRPLFNLILVDDKLTDDIRSFGKSPGVITVIRIASTKSLGLHLYSEGLLSKAPGGPGSVYRPSENSKTLFKVGPSFAQFLLIEGPEANFPYGRQRYCPSGY